MGMGRFSIREKLIPKVPLILYLVLAVDGSLVQGYIRRVVEDETEDNGVSRFVNIIIERETATGAPSNDPFTDPTEVPTIGNSQTSSSPRPSQGPFHTPSLRISSHHPTSSPLSEPTLVPLRPNGTVNFVGDGGAINALLDRCQGDCDSDNDCSEGLSCFQRTAMDDPFPGCNGTMLDDLLYTDVCINLMDLPSASPTMSKMPSTSPTATPSGTPIAEPTWFPTRQPIVQPSAAPAEKPSMVPTRVLGFAVRVGNDFGPGLPLKNCQGDCDSDSDCEFDLLCWRRNSATDPLPGCIGSLDDDTDICVERNFLPTVSPTIRPTPRPTFGPGITFKIRMYWNHYFWQEENFERKWCVSHDYSRDYCWYDSDFQRSCKSDEMYIDECGDTSYQQEFELIEFGNREALIKVAEQDRCWTRRGEIVKLEPCDYTGRFDRQIFYAKNGDFNDNRFEISQPRNSDDCVTTHHHPKAREVVQMDSCGAARSHTSNYWRMDPTGWI